MVYDTHINVFGDIIGVHWTGSVWQSPCNGRQHSREWDALADELRQYLSDCGEDVEHIDGQYVRDNYEIITEDHQ